MHHLEGRRAAIDDDRLAVAAELDGLPGDGALLVDVKRLVDAERPSGKADELRRRQRLGAAAHPAKALLHMQRGDIAADRGFGRTRQLDEFLYGGDRLFLNRGQDDPMALFLVHGCSCPGIKAPAATVVNHLRSIFFMLRRNMIDIDRL